MIESYYNDPWDYNPLYEMDDDEREAYYEYMHQREYERSIPTAAERNRNLH